VSALDGQSTNCATRRQMRNLTVQIGILASSFEDRHSPLESKKKSSVRLRFVTLTVSQTKTNLSVTVNISRGFPSYLRSTSSYSLSLIFVDSSQSLLIVDIRRANIKSTRSLISSKLFDMFPLIKKAPQTPMLCFDPSPKSIIPTRALSGEKSVKSVKVPFFRPGLYFCVSVESRSRVLRP
jgi:hypothetical protein